MVHPSFSMSQDKQDRLSSFERRYAREDVAKLQRRREVSRARLRQVSGAVSLRMNCVGEARKDSCQIEGKEREIRRQERRADDLEKMLLGVVEKAEEWERRYRVGIRAAEQSERARKEVEREKWQLEGKLRIAEDKLRNMTCNVGKLETEHKKGLEKGEILEGKMRVLEGWCRVEKEKKDAADRAIAEARREAEVLKGQLVLQKNAVAVEQMRREKERRDLEAEIMRLGDLVKGTGNSVKTYGEAQMLREKLRIMSDAFEDEREKVVKLREEIVVLKGELGTGGGSGRKEVNERNFRLRVELGECKRARESAIKEIKRLAEELEMAKALLAFKKNKKIAAESNADVGVPP